MRSNASGCLKPQQAVPNSLRAGSRQQPAEAADEHNPRVIARRQGLSSPSAEKVLRGVVQAMYFVGAGAGDAAVAPKKARRFVSVR